MTKKEKFENKQIIDNDMKLNNILEIYGLSNGVYDIIENWNYSDPIVIPTFLSGESPINSDTKKEIFEINVYELYDIIKDEKLLLNNNKISSNFCTIILNEKIIKWKDLISEILKYYQDKNIKYIIPVPIQIIIKENNDISNIVSLANTNLWYEFFGYYAVKWNKKPNNW